MQPTPARSSLSNRLYQKIRPIQGQALKRPTVSGTIPGDHRIMWRSMAITATRLQQILIPTNLVGNPLTTELLRGRLGRTGEMEADPPLLVFQAARVVLLTISLVQAT